jgi:hypothetical protein
MTPGAGGIAKGDWIESSLLTPRATNFPSLSSFAVVLGDGFEAFALVNDLDHLASAVQWLNDSMRRGK